jgi:Spy/CpxP family protein refolding chaperone
MKRTWRRRTVGLAISVSLLAPAGFAAGRARPGERGALLERAMDRLELNEDQRSRVKAALAHHRDEIRQQMEAVIASREAEYVAIHAEPFEESRIRAAARALGEAQADLAVTRARIASEVRSILTVEQRARLDEMWEDVRALAGRGRERRGRAGS